MTTAWFAPSAGDNARPLSWQEANRQHLYASLDVVTLRLALAASTEGQDGQDSQAQIRKHESTLALAEEARTRAASSLQGPSTLAALAELFELSAFERDVLLLAAAPRLSPRFAQNSVGTDRTRPRAPTFALAFQGLPSPHWTALTPVAPLRRHHLIELEQPDDPLQSPLRIDERILFFLLGIPTVDARLQGILEPLFASDDDLPAPYMQVARQLAALWSSDGSRAPVIQICGPDLEGKRLIVRVASALSGHSIYAMRAADAVGDPSNRVLFARLLDRELALAGATLLLADDDDDAAEGRASLSLISRLRMPVVVARRDPLAGLSRPEVRIDLEPLDLADQRRLWRTSVGDRLGDGDQPILDQPVLDQPLLDQPLLDQIDRIVGHFRFGPTAIRGAATALAGATGQAANADLLWDICRKRGRSRLSDLAQRVESDTGWDDLILPQPQKQLLEQIVLHLVHKTKVHEGWGFGRRGARGLGLTALFAGDSGTGKTLAAEVIANQVRLDLWRVDLSRMLDKYIGETEKNLRRIFDAAEESGAVLLFDEADALFAKRTDVKDSVDRFANVAVSYLLQRMESYGGLAILTTNLRGAMDTAFLRRIRFVVQFPFPRAEQRALIWGRAFPKAAPTAGLDPVRLAQLNVAGGNIRNIAINAAFLAADEGRAIAMDHVLRAARCEYTKLERSLAESEIRGWT